MTGLQPDAYASGPAISEDLALEMKDAEDAALKEQRGISRGKQAALSTQHNFA